MPNRDHLIFYDQDCGFCRRMLRIVIRRDQKVSGRLTPVALQDPLAARELAGYDEEERLASWHLKGPTGEVSSGGAALAPLVEILGLPVALATFLRRHAALADGGYRWVADHRTVLGRLTRRLPDLESPVEQNRSDAQ